MSVSSPSGSALLLARAQVVGKVMENLLEQVDFGRIGDDHAPELQNLCRSLMTEAVSPAVLRQLGGSSGVSEAAEELADDLVKTRGFLSLLQHSRVSDILVNGLSQIYVEQDGQLHSTGIVFPSEAALERTALWMTARVGRPVTSKQPMVDARLPDGSRLNVIIPPLALDGVVISIRRFHHQGLDLAGLAKAGAFPADFQPLLGAMVAHRLNILISGGTGAGKTTLLNALSQYIPERERVVSIEDSAELALRQTHVVRLETRLADAFGDGEVTTRMLVRNALRMRPDRMLVGEGRGAEALDMLQAMNTGHEGSMSTIHANTPRDALERLATMVGMSDVQFTERGVRGQIARSLDAIIHVRRLADGRRVVDRISEVGLLQGDMIAMQDVLRFDEGGPGGRRRFVATGVRPSFVDRLEKRGAPIDARLWRLEQPLPDRVA